MYTMVQFTKKNIIGMHVPVCFFGTHCPKGNKRGSLVLLFVITTHLRWGLVGGLFAKWGRNKYCHNVTVI